MLLKGTLAAALLGVCVVGSAGFMLELPNAAAPGPEGGRPGTLALAPMSLGNPTAAATLRAFTEPAPLDAAPGAAGDPATAPPVRHRLVVGRGDTLAQMLVRAGVGAADAHGAIAALRKHFDPKRLRRGDPVFLIFRPPALGTPEAAMPSPGRFLGVEVEPDYEVQVRVVRKAEGGFEAEKREKRLDRRPDRAEGRIASSLYVDGRRAGVPNPVLVEMIRAFSWDVDFQRDVRAGDKFEVMYERAFDGHGRHVHSGPIRFAALELSGKRYAIYLHTTADGTTDYFDDKGRSARKALMRTPIDGARLTSGFGRRRHPILGYNKMHRGVDFAAPSGTPIYAAGNGVVVAAGRNGAYGNYVRIRHNSRYSTAYGHLRSFARGLSKGKRVTQGQAIGTVGTTGRSTGPHLHYEILVGGRQTNPLKVRMPSGRKLKGDALEDFLVRRAAIDEAYAALRPAKVAAASE